MVVSHNPFNTKNSLGIEPQLLLVYQTRSLPPNEGLKLPYIVYIMLENPSTKGLKAQAKKPAQRNVESGPPAACSTAQTSGSDSRLLSFALLMPRLSPPLQSLASFKAHAKAILMHSLRPSSLAFIKAHQVIHFYHFIK